MASENEHLMIRDITDSLKMLDRAMFEYNANVTTPDWLKLVVDCIIGTPFGTVDLTHMLRKDRQRILKTYTCNFSRQGPIDPTLSARGDIFYVPKARADSYCLVEYPTQPAPFDSVHPITMAENIAKIQNLKRVYLLPFTYCKRRGRNAFDPLFQLIVKPISNVIFAIANSRNSDEFYNAYQAYYGSLHATANSLILEEHPMEVRANRIIRSYGIVTGKLIAIATVRYCEYYI